MATAYKIKPRVSIERKEEGIVVKFPYNPDYIAKIKTIEGYRWHLPDIQRSFVWKPDQIYKLFDSLMRGYPISTFLFWKLDRDLVMTKNIKLLKFVGSNELKGKYIERKKDKELYFDALSCKEEKDDGVLYAFKFFDRNNGNSFITIDNSKIKSIWVNVKRIYEIESGKAKFIKKFVDNVVRSRLSFDDFKDDLFDNINDLYAVLTSAPIINYYPEREKDEDKVLDIFVRTNAGRTKLSYSDLLFSKIKLRWDKAREEYKNLREEINRNIFYFNNDFILKTCLVIFGNFLAKRIKKC